MYCGVPSTTPVAVRSSGEGLGEGTSSSTSVDWLVRPESLGQAPVHHQGLAVRAQHDIRRLQVAVHDPLVVGIGHRVAHRDEPLEQPRNFRLRWPRSRRRESAAWNASIASCKVSALDEGHGVERPVVVMAQAVDRDDAGMLQPGGDHRLAEEPPPGRRRGAYRAGSA